MPVAALHRQMTEKKRCIRCDRAIDASARICPFCNWDQSDANVPVPQETAAPVYEPRREFPLRKYGLMAGGGVVLVIVAFALGSHVHTAATAPPTTATTDRTNAAPVKPAPHPDITLVPSNDTSAPVEQPITSAPAANATAGLPNEYQRSDATAVSSAEYAQLAARAAAERKKQQPLVDPRTLTGPAYAQGTKPAQPNAPQPQISSSGPAATPPAPPAESAPAPQAEAPRAVRTPPVPEYQPIPDVQVNETATVRLTLTIGADGRVKEVDIGGEGIEGQTGKIIGTVQTWRFKPATENGVPVQSTFSTALSFHGNQ